MRVQPGAKTVNDDRLLLALGHLDAALEPGMPLPLARGRRHYAEQLGFTIAAVLQRKLCAFVQRRECFLRHGMRAVARRDPRGPRAGVILGGWGASPMCVRIFFTVGASVIKPMMRISVPQIEHRRWCC